MKLNPDNFKISHIIAIVGGFFLLGLWFINQPVEAKPIYHPITPAAQENYDAWASQRCTQEKALAQANLADIGNGVKIDGKDLNELYQKANQNCSTNTQQSF